MPALKKEARSKSGRPFVVARYKQLKSIPDGAFLSQLSVTLNGLTKQSKIAGRLL